MLAVEERGKFADPLTTVPQSRDDPHSGSEYPATDVWVPRRRDTYNVHYLDLPIMVTIWRGSGHQPITVTPHFFGRKMSYKMPSRIFLQKMPRDLRILLFALILFLQFRDELWCLKNIIKLKKSSIWGSLRHKCALRIEEAGLVLCTVFELLHLDSYQGGFVLTNNKQELKYDFNPEY